MTIKIGIIGCGKIAQVRHLPEYDEHPEAKVYGLFDINLPRARKLAEQYGAKAYDSYEALLADPEIDAVSVCAANFAHAEITIAALNAGKHVYIDKPLAVTAESAKRIAEAAAEARPGSV